MNGYKTYETKTESICPVCLQDTYKIIPMVMVGSIKGKEHPEQSGPATYIKRDDNNPVNAKAIDEEENKILIQFSHFYPYSYHQIFNLYLQGDRSYDAVKYALTRAQEMNLAPEYCILDYIKGHGFRDRI